MEELIELGIDRILTSGQQKIAPEGAALISDLVQISNGRIIIMPGSGVKEDNIEELIRITGAKEVHVHLEKQEPSRMIFKQPRIYMGIPDQLEFEHPLTDRERIQKVRRQL